MDPELINTLSKERTDLVTKRKALYNKKDTLTESMDLWKSQLRVCVRFLLLFLLMAFYIIHLLV